MVNLQCLIVAAFIRKGRGRGALGLGGTLGFHAEGGALGFHTEGGGAHWD